MTKAGLLRAVVMLSATLIGSSTIVAARAQAPDPGTPDMVSAAIGHALQGDVSQALGRLRSVPESAFAPMDQAFRSCMTARFEGERARPDPAVVNDTFTGRLIEMFQSYWRRSLRDPGAREQAARDLQTSLSRELNVAANWDALESAIQERLGREGRFGLLGQTGALRELMVWRRQREVIEQVRLPDGPFAVKVIYLEGFESLGWGDWATCGRRGAGGWAKPDGLYAVTPRYASLTGEEFRVTFLGHEAQHFADFAHFPGMESWQLEYRAKLVELAEVRATRLRVLGKFLEDRSGDRSQPHGYANRQVLQDLAAHLRLKSVDDMPSVEPQRLNEAALQLLRHDTKVRNAPRAQ